MKIVITDRSGQILYEGNPDLHNNGIIIGSGKDCDIQLNKMGIAQHQIQLRYNTNGDLTLQDLQSPFGTIVDGKKIQPGFVAIIKPKSYVEISEDVFMHLQPESGDKKTSVDGGDQLFPFFLTSNEAFVRKSFAHIRGKLPRQYYSALTSVEGEMVTKVRELSAILEVTYALNSIDSFPRLLDFTLEMALAVTGGERAVIMLFNEELSRLETVAVKNFATREMNDDIQATARIVAKCFESGETFIGPTHLFKEDSRRSKSPDEVGILSLATVPLKEMSSTIGVLYVDTKHDGGILTGRIEQLLKIFASQAAVAINRTKMLHSATTDLLTGLSNQNLFLRRLSEEFCRAQRYQKDISLILMDIDHFKSINETHGENNGDRVLKEVCKIFRSATRIHDLVCRFGSDCFAMLLPETPYSGAQTVAEKLRSSLGQTKVRSTDHTIQISGSFGVASSSRMTRKPADLLKSAEKALKQARRRGGNQIA